MGRCKYFYQISTDLGEGDNVCVSRKFAIHAQSEAISWRLSRESADFDVSGHVPAATSSSGMWGRTRVGVDMLFFTKNHFRL